MSDTKLRQLERLARQTNNDEDFANYYRAALRAGELPKPRYTKELKTATGVEHYSWWELGDTYAVVTHTTRGLIYQDEVVDTEEWFGSVQQNQKIRIETLSTFHVSVIKNEKEAVKETKKLIRIVLDEYGQ